MRSAERGKSSLKVKEVASVEPEFIRENDFLTKARALVVRKDKKTIVVVEDDKPVGLLTRADLLTLSSTKSDVEVRGFCREFISVKEEENVLEAARKMIDADLKQIPVVDNDGNVTKMLDVMDVLKAIKMKKYNPKVRKVEDVMTMEVETCKHNEPITKVWEKLKKYSGLPVIKSDKIIGIITRRDVIKKGFARAHLEADKPSSYHSIERLMSTPAITISKDASLYDAIDLFLKYEIGILPVVDKKGNLVGIITRRDVIGGFLE